MPYGWRAAAFALCLACSVWPACRRAIVHLGARRHPSPAGTTAGTTDSHRRSSVAGARVLFIGNSLTEGNDLPGMVRTLASAAGLDWEVEAQLLGGAGSRRPLAARLRPGADSDVEHWDAVVLQQGPSSLPESRVNLRQWTGEFDALVRAAGGRSALYMVWPALQRISDFDRVRDSYALAARDVSGWFLPAGETWRAAWRGTPSLALYGGDGFHPTVAGSYAAALTIFAGLSGRSPLGLPAPATVDAPNGRAPPAGDAGGARRLRGLRSGGCALAQRSFYTLTATGRPAPTACSCAWIRMP